MTNTSNRLAAPTAAAEPLDSDESTLAAALAPVIDEGLRSLDLSAELAALAEIDKEIAAIKEAQANAESEAGEVQTKLTRKRAGRPGDDLADAAAAAEAYLAGGSSGDLETETSLQSRSEALKAIRGGLYRRLEGAYNRQSGARDALRVRLATAASLVVPVLRDEMARHLRAVQELSDAAKVIGQATRSGHCLGLFDRGNHALNGWNADRGREEEPIRPAGQTPEWLLAALENHREKIEAGHGSILRHVTPPREPRAEREVPRAQTADYVPGEGGSAVLGPIGGESRGVASIAITHLR